MGLQLRRVSGMTFNDPQEEDDGCKHTNQNSVWDKEPNNPPVILHKDENHREAARQGQVVFNP